MSPQAEHTPRGAQRCHKPVTGVFDAMPRRTTKASAAIWRVAGHGSNCRVTLKHAAGRRGGRRRQGRLSLERVTRPVSSSASEGLTTGRCARDNRGWAVRRQWLAGNGREYSDNNGALEQIKLSDPRKLAGELAKGMRDDTTLG
ncbi:hypothetical protein EV126DRAFT_447493 [Verticillium dahliae]|nr:hypothetical protein EV126DRAFT_447493 [Verticillium dahliae]